MVGGGENKEELVGNDGGVRSFPGYSDWRNDLRR